MATESEKRILVVDDEEDVIRYLTVLLTDAGYRVAQAANGVEAMEEIRREKPDLVSLDIMTIPVVIVTGVTNPWSGRGGEGTFQQFISSRKQVPPPDGFFEKPVDREAYLGKVRELLGP